MRAGKVGRAAREGRARDVSGAHGPACPSLSSAGLRKQGNAKGAGPYPPLGAAAPQARGRNEAPREGSRRRMRSWRQGGVRARARAGAGPAGPPRGPLEARGRLQPARGGRRELLPGGFIAHSSREPLGVAGALAGLGCGDAAGGAGHAGSARMVPPRAGGSGLGAKGLGGAPSPARVSGPPWAGSEESGVGGGSQSLRQLGASPDAPPSLRRARPLQRLRGLLPGLRMLRRRAARACSPPSRARPSAASGPDAAAAACTGRTAHASWWGAGGHKAGGGGEQQSDAAAQAASEGTAASPEVGAGGAAPRDEPEAKTECRSLQAIGRDAREEALGRRAPLAFSATPDLTYPLPVQPPPSQENTEATHFLLNALFISFLQISIKDCSPGGKNSAAPPSASRRRAGPGLGGTFARRRVAGVSPRGSLRAGAPAQGSPGRERATATRVLGPVLGGLRKAGEAGRC